MKDYEMYDDREDEDEAYDDEDDIPFWTDDEMCYECNGYGDDVYIDEDGEIQYRCFNGCPIGARKYDEELRGE